MAFDEDNKAKIALAKTATFEDLLGRLVAVDPSMQQIIDDDYAAGTSMSISLH